MKEHTTVAATLSTTPDDICWAPFDVQLCITKRLLGLYGADVSIHCNRAICYMPARRAIVCSAIPSI